MVDATATDINIGDTSAKKSKFPLVIGLLLALMGAGGGFAVVSLGLLGESQEESDIPPADVEALFEIPDTKFIPLEPLIISLPNESNRSFLKFSAQLEVLPDYAGDVENVTPRIIDVLNSYLRTLNVDELENPRALMRLRAQMLRRVQVVTGEGRVRDLLIMEFVVN